MAVIRDDIEQFQQFGWQQIASDGDDSLEELVGRVASLEPAELEQSLLALEEGLADAKIGRFRPVRIVFDDLAARYNVELPK